jgi:signal transduction histidine kinase
MPVPPFPDGDLRKVFPARDGETAALIRAMDWERTAIGPPDQWSPALRMVVDLMMVNRSPMILWWGPSFVQLYNDACVPIPGDRHPRSMGQPASECWPEIWSVIGPLVEAPFRGGPATSMEDLPLHVRRHGFTEETHFTIAFSPVPDDTVEGGIGGVLATVHEITGKVVGDRRLVALRELGARAAEARTAEAACATAAQVLERHALDLPFALVYLLDEEGGRARLGGAAGVAPGAAACPLEIALHGRGASAIWPLAAVRERERSETVAELALRIPGPVPPGPWSDPPRSAVVAPIRSARAHHLAGFLVAGVSARLPLDDRYRDFVGLVAAQLATGIASARAYRAYRAYDDERRRAEEALAELDRAKTTFFSNVSHELRTPLALVLGPIEDLLSRAPPRLAPEERELASVAHRNALRLLKLVNTLLDFARIEAGRVEAVYEPVDLPALTAELASSFRPVVERAGMELVVCCPPIAEPVYVDRDMWEKIVLNLLSNAFKFTLHGRIELGLRAADGRAVLTVADTGTGIAPEELGRVFERFHRVRGARGRTQEGTGIGLALVQELARLHGGDVAVESAIDRGSIFRVAVPLGRGHLPAEKIGARRTLGFTATGAGMFVEEALRWLPDREAPEPPFEDPPAPSLGSGAAGSAPAAGPRPRIVLAYGNADMRDHLRRVLAQAYEVEAVADGGAALEALRRARPALLLTDVMMPVRDGLALLREVRADPALRTLPVIVLSARAGEEAELAGLGAGADAYLAKPSGARELLARVGAQLELARVRREAEVALRQAKEQLEESDRRKDHFLAVLSHELRNPLTPIRNSLYILERVAPGSDHARRAHEVMGRQVEQLAHLVDDLLDLTRITRGKIQLQRRRLDLNELVARTVDDNRSLFEGSGVELRFAAAPGPVMVHADRTRVAQVVSNLLQNAATFTPHGGRVGVAVAAEPEGAQAVVTVEDTGAGMAPQMLARLFEPFMQADETLDRSRGGLGLGLALVRGLVALHGGAVDARSAGLGHGSEFTVRLPLELVAPRADEVRHAPPARVPRRVLVIEDGADSAHSLQEVLRLQGHEVVVAHNGPDGVAAARTFRPDVILCDIGLPGMDGFAVARALRAEAALKRARLVALTGYALPDDLQRAAEAGFDRHLAKPPDLAALARILDGAAGEA